MRERLEDRVSTLNMEYLKQHAEAITGQTVTLSPNFSAGQYWVCFELLVADGGLIIARVRLPQHPTTPTLAEKDESYAAKCEIATMRFAKQRLPELNVPDVYTYQGPGSPGALQVGAPYMLIEGFYGTTLDRAIYGDDSSTNFNTLSVSRFPCQPLQPILTNPGIRAGAYHSPVDRCPSNAGNPDLPRNRVNL